MLKPILVALGVAAASPVLAGSGSTSSAKAVDKANAAAMDRMMSAMALNPSGDPDKDFARMMVPHHQGAIDMAKVELQYGKDPAMLALAQAIVAAQEAEIAAMKAFLAKRK